MAPGAGVAAAGKLIASRSKAGSFPRNWRLRVTPNRAQRKGNMRQHELFLADMRNVDFNPFTSGR